MSIRVVWPGREGIEVEPRDVPPPGLGELKIRIEASGLCGTDLHIASGEYPFARPGVTIGHEFAGTIVEVGPDVEGFGVGERVVVDPNIPCRTCEYCHDSRPHLCVRPQALGVTLNGGLSEFAVLPAPQAYRVPEGLPPEAAALTEPLACTLHAVDLGGLRPGERALVLGAGPIGVLCAALLVAAGASEVLVSEPNPGRRNYIREVGAKPVEPESVSEAVAERGSTRRRSRRKTLRHLQARADHPRHLHQPVHDGTIAGPARLGPSRLGGHRNAPGSPRSLRGSLGGAPRSGRPEGL